MLKKIDCKKSTHSCDFPAFISRDFAEDMAVPIADIINATFRQQEYPIKYKRAEVVPIKKISAPSTFKEYRPISLLWHCGKIIEYFFLEKLKPHISKHISNEQFAYQPKKGTTDALIAAIDDWTHTIDNKNNAGVEVIFEDFSKAFDLMQPALLHEALVNMSVPHSLIKLTDSFLNDRTQRVRINDVTSKEIKCSVGVPQGTLCGPWFWLAFSNSFNSPSSTIRYADDTTCYWPVSKTDTKHLDISQNVADYSTNWSDINGMKLNPQKTKMMMIATQPEKYTAKSSPTIDDQPIDNVSEMKFLGITIDNKLNFKAHLRTIISKANQRQHLLLKLKRNGITTEKLRLFYLSYVRSVATYAAPAFVSLLSKVQLETLESVQKRCSKVILPHIDSYTERIATLKIPRLIDFMFEQGRQHFAKVCHEDHVLNKRLPPKSKSDRILNSSGSRVFNIPRTRLKMRESSFFIYYSKLS